jgi:hypothetical protein
LNWLLTFFLKNNHKNFHFPCFPSFPLPFIHYYLKSDDSYLNFLHLCFLICRMGNISSYFFITSSSCVQWFHPTPPLTWLPIWCHTTCPRRIQCKR